MAQKTRYQTDGGLGMPRPAQTHQHILSRLVHRGYQALGIKQYDVLPEMALDWSNGEGLVPDLTVVLRKEMRPVMYAEVTRTHGVRRDCDKLSFICLTEQVPYGFVYDFEADKWFRYDLAAREWTETALWPHGGKVHDLAAWVAEP